MTIESINIVKKIAKRITSSDGSNIVVLFDNINPVNTHISANSIISINGFLKNLKGYSKIQSIQEAPIPDIRIEDSELERQIKALDVEWKSERKQLDLLVNADGQDWIEIGSISLLRQQGYPYTMHSLLDFFTDGLADEFGNNGKVGCRIKDVGYGLLESSDLVTIHGSYLQEIVYKVETQPTRINLTCNCSNTGGNNNTSGNNNTGGNTSTEGNTNTGDEEMTPISNFQEREQYVYGESDPIIINANTNRKYLSIQNIDNSGNCFIRIFSGSSGISIRKLLPGQTFEITRGGLYYTGNVELQGNCSVRIVEGT